jgi:hypothetical protein
MRFRAAMTLWLLCAGGCGLPETRFLSWYPRHPGEEARSYSVHDPFPDESAGPDTATRPRSFVEPRSETSRNQHLAQLEMRRQAALSRGMATAPPGVVVPAGAVQGQPAWQQVPPPVAVQPIPTGGSAPAWNQ